MQTDHPHFEAALRALDAGDEVSLRELLGAEPALVRARVTSSQSPYDGYFHSATLLHHVAGNPIRGELAANIVDIARTLLEAGADPDAGCGGGPAQPDTAGGTTLGLVTSGAQAHRQGHTEALIDVLLERGATLDPDGGMFGSLYHTVEHQGQREVARMLHDRGVRADLPTAAGLGRLTLAQSFVGDDGRLVPGADDIWRRSARGGSSATEREIFGDALVAAAVNGWPDVVAWLLETGAPIDLLRPWAGFSVTALHGAAWAGWPEVVTLLLDRGADATIREPVHNGTARVWAQHSKRASAVAAFDAAGVER